MGVAICPSIHLSILSIHLIYPSYLSILSIHLIYLSYLSIHLICERSQPLPSSYLRWCQASFEAGPYRRGVLHDLVPFLENVRWDFRDEAYSHPKLSPGRKAGMTGLGRAVLMVCSVDDQFAPLLNEFCKMLGKHVGDHAVVEECQQRRDEALRWIENGSFSEVAAWVNGKKSPGPGHRVGSKKEYESGTSAQYLRDSLGSIGFKVEGGKLVGDGTHGLSDLSDTFYGTITSFISRGQRSKPKVGYAVPILSPTQDYQLRKGRHDSRNFGFAEMGSVIVCSPQAHAITCGLQVWEDAPFENPSYLSILSIYPSYLSILSIYLIYLSILSIYLIYLSILSIHLFYLSYLSIHLIYLSYLSTYLIYLIYISV